MNKTPTIEEGFIQKKRQRVATVWGTYLNAALSI